jgi:hypothetical protein
MDEKTLKQQLVQFHYDMTRKRQDTGYTMNETNLIASKTLRLIATYKQNCTDNEKNQTIEESMNDINKVLIDINNYNLLTHPTDKNIRFFDIIAKVEGILEILIHKLF